MISLLLAALLLALLAALCLTLPREPLKPLTICPECGLEHAGYDPGVCPYRAGLTGRRKSA